jgi:hypothetical protein
LAKLSVLVSIHLSWVDARDGRAHVARAAQRLDATVDPAEPARA